MKYTLILTLVAFLFSCSSDVAENERSDTENRVESEANESKSSNIVTDFLQDVSSLEDETSKTPIVKFQEEASAIAVKVIQINKDNIEDFLSEAQDYKYCVITTGDHTIIRIDDFSNCKQSGSWAACMPFATGYIKKGALVFQEDFMNNIIGRPDSQERIAYLFN